MLEFDAEGIDNVFSSALASIVRKEVIKASDYKLVDRNSMNEILAEQGLSQSGCVSSECAVEVSKLLGVQQMVSGSLSALGSLFLLDINIIDVSIKPVLELSKNNIDDEHWLFCIENEISGELAHEFLLFNIPKSY